MIQQNEVIVVKPARPPALVAPKGIEYHVLTKETADSKLSDNPALVCLNWDDYLTMSQYNQDILLHIRLDDINLDYYEGVVDDLDK